MLLSIFTVEFETNSQLYYFHEGEEEEEKQVNGDAYNKQIIFSPNSQWML